MNSIPFWLRALRAYCHFSPIGRGKQRLILWARNHLTVPRVVVKSNLDHALAIRLCLWIWVDFNIYCMGLYEYHLASFFKKQLKPNSVFIDAGAYIGQYAMLAAQDASKGFIYAFEPNPESSQRLEEHARQNELTNIEVVNKALGEHTGTTEFYLAEQPFQSSMVSTHAPYQRVVKVTVTSLDAFYEERKLTHVDILKIDVEETEDELIRGALTLLSNARPLVIIEIGRRAAESGKPDSLDRLSSLGYSFYTLHRNSLRPLANQLRPGLEVIAFPAKGVAGSAKWEG